MEERVKEFNQLINNYIVKNDLDHNAIFQNIWLFYTMSNELNETLKEYSEISNVKDAVKFSKRFDIIKKIELIKKFYKKYNINIDLDKLIADGTIEFVESDIDEKPFYYNGRSFKKNGRKLIKVSNNGTIADVPIIIHELGHFRNQLDGNKTTSIREIFTEALARIDELLFLDFLSQYGYEDEIRNFKIYLLQCSANNAYYGTPVLKMFLLFDELGDISIDSYKLYFGDTKNYELELKIFEEEITRKDFYLDEYVKYVFDTYISSYLFLKFKDTNIFLEDINKLHELVKTNKMIDCLKLIGLNNLGEQDREILLDSVKEYINNITEEKNKVRTK